MTPKLKVLIVDDEKYSRETTRLVLEDFTFSFDGIDYELEYSEAESGKDACGLLKERKPSEQGIALIWLDIVMEDTETGTEAGFEVLEYIKSKLNDPICQIILYTGQTGLLNLTKEELEEFANTNVLLKADDGDGQTEKKKILKKTELGLQTYVNLKNAIEEAKSNEERLSNILINLYQPLFDKKHRTDDRKEFDTYIINLLQGICRSNGKYYPGIDAEAIDMLFEMRLKGMRYLTGVVFKLIDGIRTYGPYSKEKVLEAAISVENNQNITTGLKWNKSIDELFVLFLSLCGYSMLPYKENGEKYLNNSKVHNNFFNFYLHYNGIVDIPKLEWHGTKEQLALLLVELIEEKNMLSKPEHINYSDIVEKHYIIGGEDIEALPNYKLPTGEFKKHKKDNEKEGAKEGDYILDDRGNKIEIKKNPRHNARRTMQVPFSNIRTTYGYNEEKRMEENEKNKEEIAKGIKKPLKLRNKQEIEADISQLREKLKITHQTVDVISPIRGQGSLESNRKCSEIAGQNKNSAQFTDLVRSSLDLMKKIRGQKNNAEKIRQLFSNYLKF